MLRISKFLTILFLVTLNTGSLASQVRVRLFTGSDPESALFSVTRGEYRVDAYNGNPVVLKRGEVLLILKFKGRLALKTHDSKGFICDSVSVSGSSGEDLFSLRISGKRSARQFYSGDLQCYPDLGTLLLINRCGIESYIAGVVRAEGGAGKNGEYFKTQAIIARTYMHKSFNKHLSDGFNLCDDTHCQAFNGITSDSLIIQAVHETNGMVILARDSTLINSAFHSNCGGETSASGDVWLMEVPYLKSVKDPYCLYSRNATWQKSISTAGWTGYLKEMGYTGDMNNKELFQFSQKGRTTDYRAGSFTLPLLRIRSDLKLRSAYFSVTAEGDSVVLKGRGYGHGVGLCQEGAMVMASKGFDYKQIIGFYYAGVIITDIKNAKVLPLTP